MRLLELTPLLRGPEPGAVIDTRPWNSAAALRSAAAERGHRLTRLEPGPAAAGPITDALAGVDGVLIAPQSTPQPDTPTAGRDLAAALLPLIRTAAPAAHLVLVSHFLVGHGRNHPNGKPGTWALRDVEHALRAGPSGWTILRPTWLSQDSPGSYAVRLSQDPLADGLVTSGDIAAVVLAAFESPAAARGLTAAVHSVPAAQPVADTGGLFAGLLPDAESAGVR
ncbi:NAD(P)H-binding protein [Actinacidiphila sp. ITFR-21]|uniref:NAD(P)H-binding protein n=1 Tax=Actinacidiphila sp. ITFR-21 TaxID=3075199 RepID=UPI00288A6645|nr:NAD(P)H-binding protein [Streptomyces sp. ITFR-21]WNI14239.1 NAD(P)H-binding protein [Streptomyces sp. ITFR-21]